VPSITRQQLIAWSALALVILLIGAYYLRGQISGGSAGPQAAPTLTMAVKEKTSTAAFIKIHVAGAVNQPGLYEMTAGDRIADALAAAGGTQPEADLAGINLAAKLADGQQVLVPRTGETAAAGSAGAVAAASPGSDATFSGPMNLNSATVQQLENLEGVGPKTAQKIIDYREANGGFKTVEELMEVPGIGPSKFEQIKDQVCV
jgi:competence protein ComEA